MIQIDKSQKSPIRQIAVIGTYLPRQCGIATFTTDLCEALAGQLPDATIFAIAINDANEGYPYPSRVRLEIAEQDIESYRQAAEFLNSSGVDLVILQHEFGIFGGPAGNYVLELLRRLRMPFLFGRQTTTWRSFCGRTIRPFRPRPKSISLPSRWQKPCSSNCILTCILRR